MDLRVVYREPVGDSCVLLKLTDEEALLPVAMPGQFVQVLVDGAADKLLRRPISIHFVDYERNELHLLVRPVGAGTRRMVSLRTGDTLNVLLPLGKGFTLPETGDGGRMLLIGGGVGVAPLLYLGSKLRDCGCEPVFVLGAKSAGDLPMREAFREYGRVHVMTEDGSAGERGLVTDCGELDGMPFDRVYCCGPKPMLVAVARMARDEAVSCEVSLENMMACGLGACLCCVEDTKRGNVCVCTEGPVFNTDELKWRI